ncbi:acyl-CoA dehydrogenase family protein [Sedimenticola selenatireducens]|uniref:Acyl-CoA dehydrogenase n=1 Tax=Sedimenticola selenatireducens TaxID=191960 RepID=A0A2N6CTV9_9GAMM|nr:acyl-CoA dehydrogenase family protein [Sedimenticola selenatireducens]PLX60595.1 MAG: acyl-CoA dehydrogenase [Sedimenticola selenatireducens]
MVEQVHYRASGFAQWPFFEDRHRNQVAALDSFAREQLVAVAEDAGEDDDAQDIACREIVRRLGEAGFLNCSAVVDARGQFDVRSLCLSRDTLACHAPLADFAFAMQGLGTGPISIAGSAQQRADYLPPVMRGERLAAFALSEPDAGSDVSAISTTARREGADFVLDGIKTWISNGGIADHYVVFARTGEAPGARGLSAFIVDADNPGFSVVERIRVIAPHPLATIRLENCRVPASAMVGNPGEGFKVAMGTLDVFRTTVGAAALGFARRGLSEALARVQERSVFGKLLSEFQLTQAKIAEMATEIDAASLLVYRSAWSKDTFGGRNTAPSSMAKMYATEKAQEVIDKAVQLFGGLGVVHGVPVESLYRDIRALRIYEGTTEVQTLVIANAVLSG